MMRASSEVIMALCIELAFAFGAGTAFAFLIEGTPGQRLWQVALGACIVAGALWGAAIVHEIRRMDWQ